MYEGHYGFSGPAFRMSPDPEFLFGSENQRDVLATMRGIFEREPPFLVVSGAMGVGKTTLMRTWFREFERDGISVVHLANTQLDRGELLSAIAARWRVGETGGSDADEGTIDRLQPFLLSLGHAPTLLAIDEAQNLAVDALQGLIDLADAARSFNARLRICLSGQPELCQHAAALPTLAPLVQRWCHLDALAPAQTQQYIEHRLLKVGWVGVPSIELAAFGEIHRFTGGVPRRINALTHRLLLSLFLGSGTRIDASSVVTVARALRAETGDGPVDRGASREAYLRSRRAPVERGAIVLLASGRSDHVKAVPLLHAIALRNDLPGATIVSVAGAAIWRSNEELHTFVGLSADHVSLADESVPSLDAVAARFEAFIDQNEPAAVVVFDGDPRSQCCAMLAAGRELPLIHVGSDAQAAGAPDGAELARAAIRQIANLRFDCQDGATLVGSHAAPRACSVGNVAIDAVRLALQKETQRPRSTAVVPGPAERATTPRGYGVVALKPVPDMAGARPCRAETLAMLRDVSRDLPLVWPSSQAQQLARDDKKFARSLQGCEIRCNDDLSHAEFIDLLRDATCVLTDSLDVIEEAAALRVPCISFGVCHVRQGAATQWSTDIQPGESARRVTRAVWQIVFNGAPPLDAPSHWDGHAAPRIATQIARWLDRAREGEARTEALTEFGSPPR